MGTVTNIWGAETGGLEELSSVLGSPSVLNTNPPPGGNYYYEVRDATPEIRFDPFESISDPGGGYIFGVRFWVDIHVTGQQGIFNVNDSGGNILDLSLSSLAGPTPVLRIADQGGVTTIELGDLSQQWHYLEVYFEYSNSGDQKVWLNGVLVSDLSGRDMLATAPMTTVELNSNSGSADIRWDDMYFMGAAVPGDRLGSCRVVGHQQQVASATPDDGTALDTGTWDLLGYTPANANEVDYNTTAAGLVFLDGANANGQGRGPLDQELDDNRAPVQRRGADTDVTKFIWDLKRGNGGATNHFGLYGDSNDTASTATQFAVTLIVSYAIYSTVVASKPVPEDSLAQGLEVFGPRDIFCREMWAMALQQDADPMRLNSRPQVKRAAALRNIRM